MNLFVASRERAVCDELARAGSLARSLDNTLALLDNDLTILWTNTSEEPGRSGHELICGQQHCNGSCPIAEALERGGAVEVQVELIGGTVRRRIAAEVWDNPAGTILVQYSDNKRNLSADALRTSVERYRALVENMAEGLAIIDSAEKFVMVNPAAEQIFGVPAGLLEGRCLSEFLSAEDFQRTLEETGMRRQGQTSVYQTEIIRPDGESRRLQLTASPRFDDEGEYLGAFALFQDVTERYQMEQALRDSERNLRLLYDNSPVMLQSVDEQGFVRNVNAKWLETMGYTRDEVIGRRLDSFLAPGHVDHVMHRTLPRFWRQGYLEGQHSRYVRRDGTVIDAEVSAVAMRDPNGRRIALVVMQDITQRLRAEEQLLRLYTAIEQAGECILVADTDGRVQYVNSAIEKLTGYARRELIDELGRFRLATMHDAALVRSLEGSTWEGVLECPRRDGGKMEVEASISPVHDEAGSLTSYVCAYRDVSKERSLQEQLAQAQKMEAVGQLAGGVAHEFNNLLTAIIGNLSLAELEGPDSPGFGQYLADAGEAAQRSADVTRQLLLFSRKNAGTLAPVDLGSIAQAAAKLARHSFPAGLELHLHTDPSCAPVMGDATMLHQVVMNLVLNARDASSNGGKISVRSTCAELCASSDTLTDPERAGKYAVLEVSDTGEGMDPATRERVFEPFFTTKPVGQGTGLGLAVVYNIIQQHGGWIELDSEPGQGTTFRIYLPQTEEKLSGGQDSVRAERGNGERILVVEDDALVLPMLRETLRGHGYDVLCAVDGPAAVNTLEQHVVDLAIIDVMLPGIDGAMVYNELKKRDPQLRALFMSGNVSSEELEQKLDGRQWPFISKPFRADKLLRAVREALPKTQ